MKILLNTRVEVVGPLRNCFLSGVYLGDLVERHTLLQCGSKLGVEIGKLLTYEMLL